MKKFKPILLALGLLALVFIGIAGVKFLQVRAMIASGEESSRPPETIRGHTCDRDSGCTPS